MVELLVVMAVISALAALLLPALQASIALARGITCTNQLRQIGLAFQSYAGDRNGRFPATEIPESDPPTHDRGWTAQHGIWTYLGYDADAYHWRTNDGVHASTESGSSDRNLLHCPVSYNEKIFIPGHTISGNGASYGMSADPAQYSNGFGTDYVAGRASQLILSKVARVASRTCNVFEYCVVGTNGFNGFSKGALVPHREKSNFLFIDGHVETSHYTTILALTADEKKIYWKAGYD